MKQVYILFLIAICFPLYGQYDNYQFGTKSGVIIGPESVGFGFEYTLDLHKHLGMGIYGTIGVINGHTIRGMNVPSNDFLNNEIFHPTTMRQYKGINLGLCKETKISVNGRIRMSILGSYVAQTRIDWDVRNSEFETIGIDDFYDLYGKRSDLGFKIDLEYLHQIREGFKIGSYIGYNSQPNFITAGVRFLAKVNRDSYNSTSRPNSSQNWIEFRLGKIGGDGVPSINNYTIEYGRSLKEKFSIYSKFSLGTGYTRNDSNLIMSLSEEDQLRFDREFQTSDHQGRSKMILPIHSMNLGGGIKLNIRTANKSKISISSGISWYRADIVRLSVWGSELDFFQEEFMRLSSIIPEFGLHFDQDISKLFYLGFKLDFALVRYNIGFGVHGGFKF